MLDLNQFIKIVLNNYNYFPLIDYDTIAKNFVIQYSDYINKIKFDSAVDETILIDQFWNYIMEVTNNQTQSDLICQIIYDYYIDSTMHTNNIYQIVNIKIDNNDYLFYDINFFDSHDIISQESLNNIQLFFLIYSKTNNLNLANRLKARYIYPLIDTINEYFIDSILS